LPGVDLNQDSDDDEIDLEKLRAPTGTTLTRNDDNEEETNQMVGHMKKMSITDPPQKFFFGKSR
jgi:hypothetical protein